MRVEVYLTPQSGLTLLTKRILATREAVFLDAFSEDSVTLRLEVVVDGTAAGENIRLYSNGTWRFTKHFEIGAEGDDGE